MKNDKLTTFLLGFFYTLMGIFIIMGALVVIILLIKLGLIAPGFLQFITIVLIVSIIGGLISLKINS